MPIIAPPVYDENWNRLENPDYSLGVAEDTERSIYHKYVIDQVEMTHEEVIREYPETGGKEVEIVVDQEEKGHWETYDKNTDMLIPNFDNQYLIDNGIPHDVVLDDIEFVQIYRKFTQEELDDMAKQQAEFEAQQQKQAENEQLLDDMPALLCAMYEQNLQLQDTVDQQEDVLCAMYETMIGGE